MPRFAPLSEFLAEPLLLPVRGNDGVVREYAIKPVDGETGLRLTAKYNTAKKTATASDDPDEEVLDDIEEVQLYRMALGDTYDQLLVDHVPLRVIKFTASTAVMWHVYGEKAASLFWETGGDPKWRPSDLAKESTTESGESQETPAAAPSTRKPASGSGTTRSRKSPNKAQPGRTSSTAGT